MIFKIKCRNEPWCFRKCYPSLIQIVHMEQLCARNANFVEIPSELSECTISALKSIGITRLYSHQV